jgi:hypothetical protein
MIYANVDRVLQAIPEEEEGRRVHFPGASVSICKCGSRYRLGPCKAFATLWLMGFRLTISPLAQEGIRVLLGCSLPFWITKIVRQ